MWAACGLTSNIIRGECIMKVLLIDPWGVNNTSEYLNGLILGISSLCNLTVFTNYFFVEKHNYSANINKVFFRLSEHNDSRYRKYIRGIEYVYTYFRIIIHLFRNKYDVLHINWLLEYNLDRVFIRILKIFVPCLVYTAHNVLPHRKGMKYISSLKDIYNLCDKIIVHGEEVKKEMIKFFPNTERKIYIQRHGCNLENKNCSNYSQYDGLINFKKYNKVLICFGAIFYNKGFDRIIEIWINFFKNTQALLIIAGKSDHDYKEFHSIKEQASGVNNIIIYDNYIEEEFLNYLIYHSDVIVLPYRHASMSGVIFTAAEHQKTVLTTDVGSIKEYLDDSVDSYVVENSNEGITHGIEVILNEDQDLLRKKGKSLHKNIESKFNWINIGNKVFNEVYSKK